MSNINAVLLALIPAFINVGLLLFILVKLPKTSVVRVFCAFIVSLTLWQCKDLLSRLVSEEDAMAYYDKVFAIGWIFFAPIFLHFIIYYTSSERLKRNLPLALLYIPFIILYVIFMSDSSPLTYLQSDFWGLILMPREGSMDLFLRFCIAGVTLFALAVLLRYSLVAEVDKIRKKQTWVMTIGILVPAVQGIITQVIFTSNGHEVPVTSTFVTFFSLSAFVALSRYKLFNVSEALSTEEVLENLNSLILIISSGGQVVYGNRAARNKLGLALGSQNYSVNKILNPFQRNDFNDNVLLRIREGLVPHNFEGNLIDAEGKMFEAEITTEIISNHGKVEGILLLISDVSETNLQKRTIDFQRGQMQQIAYIQSHIVRAPLTRIMGISDILIKDDKLSEEDRKKFLQFLETSVHELDDELRAIVDKATEIHKIG